jgi:hypothetical protein
MANNTTGSANTAIGVSSLLANTTGNNNTALGRSALRLNTTGSFNAAVGDSSGWKNIGSGNVFIGRKAGAQETAASNKFYLANDSANALMYGDFGSGQVLLGKKDATGYMFKGTRTLNVIGGILTDSVRVSPSGDWADYVFDEKYELPTLAALDQYIRTYRHLPNIPSAKEVSRNGINLADMNNRLLEKIEELTLYILQQEKRMAAQQEENSKQHKELELQKQQIQKLFQLLGAEKNL